MLIFIVLSGFVIAIVAPSIVRAFKERSGWIMAVLPAVLFAALLWQLPAVMEGRLVRAAVPWVPSLGLTLSFRLDGLGLLFALLISGIGALVMIYAGGYMKGRDDVGRFYVYLLMFMAAMLGVALADNLIALFVFWELTSVTSYLLIGFDHDRPESREGARKALLITATGGLAMMAGFILLGQMAGTFEVSKLLSRAHDHPLSAHPLYLSALALILLGAFTKSAQWPFHIWLPDAMQAPTPVSAYLHSATMVKAGIYLLARLSPVLGGTDAWFYAVSSVGLITMLAGGLIALKQTDLKAILAYTTIGWLGVLVMLLGWGTHYAVEAAMVGMLAHALYKGAMFLLVGGVDHETHTRDIRQLSGLRRAMPISAALMGLAAGSMAGLPLWFGFIAKELLLEAALRSGYPSALAWLAPTLVVLAGALNVAIAWRLFHGVFFGQAADFNGRHVHDPRLAMLLGPGILGALSVVLGAWPGLANGLAAQASSAILGEAAQVKLALWHGITTPLMLSLTALAVGTGLYAAYGHAAALLTRALGVSLNSVYDGALAGLYSFAQTTTRVLQNGTLRYYVMIILVTAMSLVGYALLAHGWELIHVSELTRIELPGLYEVLLSGVIVVTALMVTRTDRRLTAIAGMGVIGAMVSLFFVSFSAPDLALTQLLIETLMVIVFLLVFHFLPRFFDERATRLAHARDMVVSLVVGLVAGSLVLFAVGQPIDKGIAEYFVANSYTLAHGRNIVNVILVDFRGLDTLGEITVLTVAATGIYALLRGTVRR